MLSRDEWLRQIAARTEAFRWSLADRHEERAAAADSRETRRWHEGRAKGQRQRFSRIEDCGVGLGTVTPYCAACGTTREPQPVRCQQHRLCLTCRGVRAAEYRARFESARKAILRKRWPHTFHEAFLTLTYPHSGNVSEDVRQLYRAWPRFIRRLRDWLERRVGLPRRYVRTLPFFRVVEVTASDGGHAHLHVWALLPFLHHSVLRRLWYASLDECAQSRVPWRRVDVVLDDVDAERDARQVLEAARERSNGHEYSDALPWPVLDVRRVRGDAGRELVKYLVKDLDQGELVDPDVMADLFCALEGRRVVVTSRGFWLLDEPPECECGECLPAVIIDPGQPTPRLPRAPRPPPS